MPSEAAGESDTTENFGQLQPERGAFSRAEETQQDTQAKGHCIGGPQKQEPWLSGGLEVLRISEGSSPTPIYSW